MMNQHPPHIVCYAPYTSWSIHSARQVTILQALRLRGCSVSYVTCDGLYSVCDMIQAANGAALTPGIDACLVCQSSLAARLAAWACHIVGWADGCGMPTLPKRQNGPMASPPRICRLPASTRRRSVERQTKSGTLAHGSSRASIRIFATTYWIWAIPRSRQSTDNIFGAAWWRASAWRFGHIYHVRQSRPFPWVEAQDRLLGRMTYADADALAPSRDQALDAACRAITTGATLALSPEGHGGDPSAEQAAIAAKVSELRELAT